MNDNLLEGAIAATNLLQLVGAAIILAWSASVALYALRQPPGWEKWISWFYSWSLVLLPGSLIGFKYAAPVIGLSDYAIGVAQAAAFSCLMLSSLAWMLVQIINAERRRPE